jgi:predicted negative regulator of RcsB-dependent stress response
LSQELEDLREKLDKSPGNLLFRFSYAQKLFSSGNESEALGHLQICVGEREDWMFAHLLKAKLEISLGKKKDAVRSLKITIDLAKAQSHEDPLAEATELLESLV